MSKRVVAVSVKFTDEEWAIMQAARDIKSSLPVSDAVLVRELALECAKSIIAKQRHR